MNPFTLGQLFAEKGKLTYEPSGFQVEEPSSWLTAMVSVRGVEAKTLQDSICQLAGLHEAMHTLFTELKEATKLWQELVDCIPRLVSWYFTIFTLGDDYHLLGCAFPKSVGDFGSLVMFLEDLAAHCCDPSTLITPTPYSAFAGLPQNWDQQTLHWKKQELSFDIPSDFSIDATSSDRKSKTFTLDLTSNFVVSRDWLLANYAVALHLFTKSNKVIIQTPVTKRPEGFQRTIGPFTNILPLQVEVLDNDTFASVLNKTAEALSVSGQNFLPTSMKDVVGESLATVPFFSFYEYPNRVSGGLSWRMDQVDFSSLTKSLLSVSWSKSNDGELTCECQYGKNLWSDATATSFLNTYKKLIEENIRAIEMPFPSLLDIPLVSDEDEQVLSTWSGSEGALEFENLLHRQVERWAEETPNVVAVVDDDHVDSQLTYGQLNEASNRLAHYLVSKFSIKKGDVVAVSLHPTSQLVISILAVVKCGAVYMPLPADTPRKRMETLLEKSNTQAIISDTREFSLFPLPEEKIFFFNLNELESMATNNFEEEVDKRTNPALCVLYTSGTTGLPKCHFQTHKGFNRLLKDKRCRAVPPSGRVLLLSSFVFDAFSGGFWCALCSGASLVMCLPDTVLSYDTLLQSRVEKYSPVHEMFLTTSFFHTIAMKNNTYFKNIDYLIVGGEELNKEVVCLLAKSPQRPKHLVNVYGPSECAVYTTFCSCFDVVDLAHRNCMPVGIPLLDTVVHVVNEHGKLVPPRFPGKVIIGGGAVGLGYCTQAQNVGRFLPSSTYEHLGPAQEGYFYNTGDVCRWSMDGNLEFLGREDGQVKIRGHRIEIMEITTVFSKFSDIGHAVVLPFNYPTPSDTILVAFYTRKGSKVAYEDDVLIDFLRAHLPAYMVPHNFIFLQSIPLKVQMKVDRNALEAIFYSFVQSKQHVEVVTGTEEQGPSPTELRLIKVWSKVLGHTNFSLKDNFFSIGGHSLLVNRMQRLIEDEFAVRLPIRTLFSHATVETLADLISTHAPTQEDVVMKTSEIPVTVSQERFWLSSQAKVEDSSADTVLLSFWLDGPTKIPVLETAINALVARHSSLRTIFVEDNKEHIVKQKILDSSPRISVVVEDYTRDPSKIESRAMALSLVGLDLTVLPAMKVHFLKASAARGMLVVIMSHIYIDDVSLDNFMNELSDAYAAGGESTRPLPSQFRDYALRLTTDCQDTHVNYWANILQDSPSYTSLISDSPRPSLPTSLCDTVWGEIDAESSKILRALAKELHVTVFEITIVCYAMTVSRFIGQEEGVIGYTSNQHPMDDTIGLFLSILPFYFKLTEDNFSKFLLRCHNELVGNYDHTNFSFSKLLRLTGHERGAGHFPIFQLFYSYQALNRNASYNMGDVVARRHLIPPLHTTWDMTLFVEEDIGGCIIPRIEFQVDLFERSTIESFLDTYIFLLKTVIRKPSINPRSLSLVSYDKATEMIYSWNKTEGPYSNKSTLHSFIEKYADSHPDTIAVIEDDEGGTVTARSATYRELNELSNKVARHLISEKKFEKGSRIGLLLNKSVVYYSVLIGVLKAGGIFVAIDKKTPPQRLAFIKESCDLNLFATDEASLIPSDLDIAVFDTTAEWAAVTQQDANNLLLDISPEDPYLIQLTSGSTGVPKGSLHCHRGWCNAVAPGRLARVSPGQVLGATATISYDMAQQETWEAFLNGGTLVVFNLPTLLQPNLFLKRIASYHFHVFWIAPALLTTFVNIKPDCFSDIHTLHFGGESPDPGTIATLLANNPPKHAIVCYGPSETGPYAISYDFVTSRWQKKQKVPLGKPMLNSKAYLLDKNLQPVPPGAIGEIYITGESMSFGYFRNFLQTQKVFWPNPFDSGRKLYKTGDSGRFTTSGNLEFLGRNDGKVKLYGQMVNLDEVTACLLTLDYISNAVTIFQESPVDKKQMIVTYFVSTREVDAMTLKEYVSSKLARYMVPSFFVQLDMLPITSSHKINRKLLPPVTAVPAPSPTLTPKNETQKKLFEIWKKIGLPCSSIYQSFFEIGGDSIALVKFISNIQQEFGINLSFSALFQNPTISKLSKYLTMMSPKARKRTRSADYSPKRNKIEMVPLQKWLYNLYDQRGYWLSVHPSFIVKGALDKDTFKEAIKNLILRYPLLNSRISPEEQYTFTIDKESSPDDVLIWTDVNLQTPDTFETYQQLILTTLESAFRTHIGPMFYIHVWHQENESLVLFLINHLIADGPSSAQLVEEFGNLYGTKGKIIKRDYAFVNLANSWYMRPQEPTSKTFWLNMLKNQTSFGFEQQLDLPKVERYRCSFETLDLSPYLSRFHKLMKDIETTSFPILVATWAAAFRDFTSNGHVTFMSALQDSESCFGPLFSLIALDCEVQDSTPDTIADQSHTVLNKLIEAQEHARGYPLEQVLFENPDMQLPSICLISNIQHGIRHLGPSPVELAHFLKRPLAPFDIGIFVSFPNILVEYRTNVPETLIQTVNRNFVSTLECVLSGIPQDETTGRLVLLP